jgi:hypothetical protein
MLHSLASVAALHPTAPYQQSINVNTTCDFRAILHPFLTWQPVRGFSGYSGNFRASRAKSALFAAGCANVTHATDAGAPRCSAPIHLCKPGAREWLLRHHSPFRGWSCIWVAAMRLARSALRRQYRCVSGISRCSGQRKISGHIEACVVADRCGAEPRWRIRCGNVRTNDGFPLPRISMGLAIPLWL